MKTRFLLEKLLVWMVCLALGSALFWIGWYSSHGSIPTTSQIILSLETKMSDGEIKPSIVAEFYWSVSRLWDIVALPCFAVFLILTFLMAWRWGRGNYDDIALSLVAGLIVGIISGAMFIDFPWALRGHPIFVSIGLGGVGSLEFGLVFCFTVLVCGGIIRVTTLSYIFVVCFLIGIRYGFLPALVPLCVIWSPILLFRLVRNSKKLKFELTEFVEAMSDGNQQ